MDWAEIKKSINSTTGTTNEKTLDNMIRDNSSNKTLAEVLKEILEALGG